MIALPPPPEVALSGLFASVGEVEVVEYVNVFGLVAGVISVMTVITPVAAPDGTTAIKVVGDI